MRLSGILDMKVRSVKKKWKTKSFAAGVNRDIISEGTEVLDVDLNDIIEETIKVMRRGSEEIKLVLGGIKNGLHEKI